MEKFLDVEGSELIGAIDTKRSYKVLGNGGQVVTNVDARYAVSLAIRKLVRGVVREVMEPGREQPSYILTSLKVAPGVLVSQVKNVLRLKPPSISICNRSTVVERGPLQYWHVALLGMLGRNA